MKTIKQLAAGIFLLGLGLSPLTLFAQNEELQIHHINVGTGDCTAILKYDTQNQTFDLWMLVDAGHASYGTYVQPYLQNVFGAQAFDYLVATHYHTDHVAGFNGLSNGSLTADTIIDPGGYDLTWRTPSANTAAPTVEPPDYANGKAPDTSTKATLNTYYYSVKAGGLNHNLNRSQYISMFPRDLGHVITLGQVNGTDVTMTCVAGNGYTLSSNGTNDKWSAGMNENNYGLAFILQYGSFSYYVGGDLGGSNDGNINCGNYIDQETPLASWCTDNQPMMEDWNDPGIGILGHVCVMKTNHHGSQCSSNTDFLNTLDPSTVVTTYFSDLPKIATLKRDTTYIGQFSDTSAFLFYRLVDAYQNAVATWANANLDGNYLYSYGNQYPHPPLQWSYIVRVPQTVDVADSSYYLLYKGVPDTQNGGIYWQPVGSVGCHRAESEAGFQRRQKWFRKVFYWRW